MDSAEIVWFVMGAGVVAYAVTGGADYGGGVLHLFLRSDAHRAIIRKAIAPIWEANHVWLIFVIVLCFSVFPVAFAVLSTALHIPITLSLIGIVLRGSAFIFQSYGVGRTGVAWRRVFGVSSLATPFCLGLLAAALSSGAIRADHGEVITGFFAGWTSVYAVSTGVFTLALFTLLAATYLTVEADAERAETFRRVAMVLEVVTGAIAGGVFLAAARDAPLLFDRMVGSSWTLPVQSLTAASAFATLIALWRRRYRWARATAATQAALVILGWGLAMDGAVVLPDVTIHNAGTQHRVVQALLPVVAAGSLLLAPALWYLFRVFKEPGHPAIRTEPK